MKKYRVREGSIADYARIILASSAFWAVIFITAACAYPA